jgi:condensin complex subunit 3
VLARAFLEWSLASEREDGADRLPVVTAFAFHVQEAYNALLEALGALEDATRAARDRGEEAADDEGAEDELEEELAKREAILSELLRMAVKLDYGDEIGRRKVYSVIRDMLAHPHLPPGLIERCLDVLKEIMPTERELIRVVVEVVVDLREGEGEGEGEGEPEEEGGDTTQSTIRSLRRAKSKESMGQRKERHEMTPEEAARADLTEMRCLALVVSMLERVHGVRFFSLSVSALWSVNLCTVADARTRRILRTTRCWRASSRTSSSPPCAAKSWASARRGSSDWGCVVLSPRLYYYFSLTAYTLLTKHPQSIAVKSLQLFLGQIQNAPEQLKFKLLQIVFDLMVMYDQQLWGRAEDVSRVDISLASSSGLTDWFRVRRS